jgi:hypothetical protein
MSYRAVITAGKQNATRQKKAQILPPRSFLRLG